MMIDTNLSVKEIELALLDWCGGERSNIAVPNVTTGLFWGLPFEADLLVMSKAGYVTEFEIKRSYTDFVADFKKDASAHNAPQIYNFYYVVPISIIEKVMKYLREYVEEEPAVLAYDETGKFKNYGGYPQRKGGRKLFLEEQLKLARLGTLRYWALRRKGR
ncbi:MAG: hypothetical protein NC226_09710 [Bacteroides cellulosilyticus]|nr:hypothetical protein [Bacteroides cellulosilyticus]